MVSYIIRTRNRPHRVQRLLRDIARTHADAGVCEVIIVDDASQQRLVCPARLRNGFPVRSVWTTLREGWASLNAGAATCDGGSAWLVFLQDQACPVSGECAAWLDDWDSSVVAVAPDVFIDARGRRAARRVSACLPEVLPTCAFAVRREAFMAAGGFARDLSGPAAVLDLCARLLGARTGAPRARATSQIQKTPPRIVFDPRWMVARRASAEGTVSHASLLRQLRDYSYVLACNAPEGARSELLHFLDDVAPCRGNAARRALAKVLREARTMPLGGGPARVWERLTGLTAVRESLGREHARSPFRTATLVDAGRHAWVVERALAELGVRIVDFTSRPDVQVVGTLAPAPMLRSMFRRTPRLQGPRVLAPWTPPLPPVPAATTPRPAVAA